MNKPKLNNLSEIAYLPEGLYLLPDGYNSRVLSALQYALRYCHMRRQIWTEDDSYIRIVPPNPKSQESEPMEFEITRHKLYQYLLVLDFANELFQSDKRAVIIKPLMEGFELNPGFLNDAKYICNVIQGFNPRFKEHPDGSFIMIDKSTEKPLTQMVFYAMKEAADNGRSTLPLSPKKIMTAKTYASSYRHAFPGVSIKVEGTGVIFEKGNDIVGDIDTFLERLHSILENAPPFTIVPISLSAVPISPNYFRTKVKSIPVHGYDVSVTIQSKQGRVLVQKVSDDWQCAMSAENDAVDPQWDDDDDEWNAPVMAMDGYDDDEDYEDEPAETDFETENDEML